MAELADAPDLGSGAERLGGSSPPPRTNEKQERETPSEGGSRRGERLPPECILRKGELKGETLGCPREEDRQLGAGTTLGRFESPSSHHLRLEIL